MAHFSPVSLVAAWGLLLVGFLSFSWPNLGWLALAVLGLVAWLAHAALLRLLRRSRWLLVAVVLMFGWMTPGMPTVLPGATVEGLQLAGEQLARLLVSIAMVALLLDRLAINALLSGLYALMLPLARLGLDVNRLVLRLALTLRQLDAPSVASQHWLEQPTDDVVAEGMAPIRLILPRMGMADAMLLAASLVFVGSVWV